MASHRNDTPKMPYNNDPAVTDELTRRVFRELEELSAPLTELIEAAQQCYDERLNYDVRAIAFRRQQEKERIDNEAQLQRIREHATKLKKQRAALDAKIPPHLQSSIPVDEAARELERVLLELEQQKLTGLHLMTDYVDINIADAQVDIAGIQSSRERRALRTAADELQVALWEFRGHVNFHGGERSQAIDDALTARHDTALSSPELSEDKSDDNVKDAAETSSSASSVSSELRLNMSLEHADDPFRFDRSNPPTLTRLAKWLSLEDDTQAALVLNSWPVQHAFTAYRTPAGKSCAESPEDLKMVMPLFTFSNETLQKWRAHLGEKKDKDNVDVAAALFAYHVVRFLERSCEEVAWEPVISDMATFHDYDLARRHWAIVLQMYWFMEKAFANPN